MDSSNVLWLRNCKNWVFHLPSGESEGEGKVPGGVYQELNFPHINYEMPIYYSLWRMPRKVGVCKYESGLKKQDQSWR